LMNEFGIEYKKEEWRLFIDSSKTSLKVVLLHNVCINSCWSFCTYERKL